MCCVCAHISEHMCIFCVQVHAYAQAPTSLLSPTLASLTYNGSICAHFALLLTHLFVFMRTNSYSGMITSCFFSKAIFIFKLQRLKRNRLSDGGVCVPSKAEDYLEPLKLPSIHSYYSVLVRAKSPPLSETVYVAFWIVPILVTSFPSPIHHFSQDKSARSATTF